jgi:hypothetical protein
VAWSARRCEVVSLVLNGRKRLILLGGLVALAIALVTFSVGLRSIVVFSETSIAWYLERQWPSGTSKAHMLQSARSHGYTVTADVKTDASRSVRLHLGWYRILFRTDVAAHVRLDQHDRVVSVEVQKDTDSL